MLTELVTTIYLYKIYPKKYIKEKFIILFPERYKDNLITNLIYNTFKKKIKKKSVHLHQLIDFLVVYLKKKIRHDYEEKLILWFFSHFQVSINNELYDQPPKMFKIKKKFFMYIPYELNFPLTNYSTCLSKKKYPYLFCKLNELNDMNQQDRPDIRTLKQYCFKDKFQQEYIQLPEFSLKTQNVIYLFYKNLIKNYNYNKNFLKYKIKFKKKDQDQLLKYLKTMCNFFNIKKK
jgi:hypothetical protein